MIIRQPNSPQKISSWSLQCSDFCYKAISESGVLPFWIFKMEVDCPFCTKRNFAFWHFQRNHDNSAGKQYRVIFNIELQTKICNLIFKRLVRDILLLRPHRQTSILPCKGHDQVVNKYVKPKFFTCCNFEQLKFTKFDSTFVLL